MIQTKRLQLRLPCRDDAAALGEALADPEVMRYIRLGARRAGTAAVEWGSAELDVHPDPDGTT